jgi:hypothetical protein
MGDGTGLRPKAGKQREEPPTPTGLGSSQAELELGRTDERRLRVDFDFEGPTLCRLPTMHPPSWWCSALRSGEAGWVPEQQYYAQYLLFVFLLHGSNSGTSREHSAEEKHRRT